MNKFIQELKNLLSEDEFSTIFSVLSDFLKDKSESHFNDLIEIKGRYTSNEKTFLKGQILQQEFSVEKEKTRYAIILILDSIEDELKFDEAKAMRFLRNSTAEELNVNQQEPIVEYATNPKENKRSSSPLLWTLLVFCLLGLWGIWLNSKNNETETAESTIPPAALRAEQKVGYIDLHPQGWVNDFENILSPEIELSLRQIIDAHEAKTQNQIAIVTIDSFGTTNSIEDFGLQLSNQWGIGQKNKNNGILILLSKKQKKIRVFTGLGIEPILKDWDCQKIIHDKMMPAFRNNEIGAGLIDGVTGITRFLEEKMADKTKS